MCLCVYVGETLWGIRYALLTGDLNYYLAGYYLSPDYYRCFIPYEQYVLYLAIATLAVAEAVACLRLRRRRA